MRAFLKVVFVLLVLLALGAGGAWFWAGRMAGPAIAVRQPDAFIGQTSSLELTVETPDGRFSRLDVVIEQNGKTYPVFTLDQPAQAQGDQESAKRLYVMRPIGKRAVPDLQAGPARIVVRAARPVLFGLRDAESTATRDVQVRLEPPRVGVQSRFHYVNHGGAEFVVYTASPADVESGVRVGDQTYPGFPGTAVGISEPSTRVAFFALLPDQDLNTPISIFARDPAGNEVVASVEHMPFPKPFGKSRIPVDGWVGRVVPPIITNTPDMELSADPSKIVESFVRINSDLRKRNAQTIAELAKKTAPKMLWKDPFQPLGNAAVEARFADYRTYLFEGREIDQQVHLGFDLAVTTQVPILAAQNGVIVHAAYLGIYGNCVIIDHGLGVQSLYGHLSSMSVKVGDTVEKGQAIGRSGTTGLAAGDHLHFTMLVNGHPVNPVEWWDPKWMQDRVLRKIMEAGGV
ncbi:MAG: M23 family metallopeptidase [Vicinamibacterales bacterium]